MPSLPPSRSILTSQRRLRLLLLPTLALLLGGCFEESVKERLHLVFRPDATAEVEVSIELRHDDSNEAEIRRRLAELEEAWLGGFDPWALRFERLAPTSEDFYWQKREGRLSFASRLAVIDDLERLEELLADTAVSLAVEVSDTTIDLGLYPGPSGRAGRRERRQVDRLLDDWSGEVSVYLEAGEALYSYLERHPERATPCFAELFDVEPPGDDTAAGDKTEGELSAEEESMVAALGEAMGEVFAILLETEGAETLDQLAARVYDPFPAPLTLETPGKPEHVEGLEPWGNGWRVPPLAPWAALERLGGRWLSPEPVLTYVEAARAEAEQEIDILAFAAQPRRYALPPDAEEVRAALEEELEVADAYRLIWRRPPSTDQETQTTDEERR